MRSRTRPRRRPGEAPATPERRRGTAECESQPRLLIPTSVGQRGDGDKARRAEISAYLTKPVRQSELRDAIAAVLDHTVLDHTVLEEAGRAGDPSSVAGLLQRLDSDFEEVRAEFSALLLKR